MKKIFQITIWFLIATGIIFLLSFAMTEQKTVTCKALEVSLTDNAADGFIDKDDIRDLIFSEFDTLQGNLLDSINTSAIAAMLRQNPYIRKAAVFESVSGVVKVEVEREIPLVRIITPEYENYYIAESGAILPVNKGFTPHVMVASGNIRDTYHSVQDSTFVYHNEIEAASETLASLHYLSSALQNHPYLQSYIGQIYVNKNGNIELVPEDGDHIVVLGDVVGLSEKFSNLMTFYHAGKPSVKEGYRTVNLSYANQVVCKK